MKTPEQRMHYQRGQLLINHPWFGSLAMRLNLIEDPSVRAMNTDGTSIRYNPEYVAALPDAEIRTILAEEVLHCTNGHLWRMGQRDPDLFNKAADYSIYSILAGAGFQIPKDSCHDPKFDGKSAEQIYAVLSRDKDNQDGGGGKPNAGEFSAPAKPDPNGEQQDGQGNQSGPSQSQQVMTEVDWQIAAEQANRVAAKAGTLSSDIDRMTKASRESKTDPREMLERFIQQTIPCDYSFAKPNKQYVNAGLYLPSLARLNAPKFAIGFDSSGSIYACRELVAMMTELLSRILTDVKPEQIDVIYCDSSVKGVETFTPEDGGLEFTLQVKGGGGTLFKPVFDYIEKEMDEPPACLIYMTDLEGGDNDRIPEPDYPVLWVTPLTCSIDPPFGEAVRVDEWG